MYKNILVPIAFDDGADEKIKAATDIARALSDDGARITLLHVIEQVPSYAVTYLPRDYLAQTRAAAKSEIEELAEKLPNGIGLLIDGHSGRSILDWAEKNAPDLIVIASHRPGMQDLLLGSTATQVVRHAQCAVHVLR